MFFLITVKKYLLYYKNRIKKWDTVFNLTYSLLLMKFIKSFIYYILILIS